MCMAESLCFTVCVQPVSSSLPQAAVVNLAIECYASEYAMLDADTMKVWFHRFEDASAFSDIYNLHPCAVGKTVRKKKGKK